MSKWAYYNLVDQDSTIITASSEDPFFPASNLKKVFQSKVFRSQSGTPSASVVFDFKSTEEVNAILIRANDFSGVGFNGSLTFEANATSDFSSPAYSTTVSFDESFNLGFKFLLADESYRFWRVSGTGTDYLELSNIFIGKYVQMENDMELGWSFTSEDRSRTVENRYGQQFTDELNDRKQLNGSHRLLEKDEAELLNEMWDYCGKKKPVWVVMDSEEAISLHAGRYAGLFNFTARPRIRNNHYGLYDTNSTLKEAI